MGRATKWLTTSPKNVAVIPDLWPHLLLLTVLQLLRHKSWEDCVNAIVCSVWIIGNGKRFYQYKCRIRVTPKQHSLEQQIATMFLLAAWEESWSEKMTRTMNKLLPRSPFIFFLLLSILVPSLVQAYCPPGCRWVSQNQPQLMLTAASVTSHHISFRHCAIWSFYIFHEKETSRGCFIN